MFINEITAYLESIFPIAYQEGYDNSGLLVGDPHAKCSGVLITLDVTEAVIQEAINRNCNLVIAHHPLIFKGLKRLTGSNFVERSVILAVKNDVAVYAIHTNMDNVLSGVSGRMADRLGLKNRSVLQTMPDTLCKLFTFVPEGYEEKVRQAVFEAGGGKIGDYGECSFNSLGVGTFKGGPNTNPFVGEPGRQHQEKEVKIEVILPKYLSGAIVKALKSVHPYEEPAFDIIPLANHHPGIGSGLVGDLDKEMEEVDFLQFLYNKFQLKQFRHTPLTGKSVSKVAVCGGAGSFLISAALRAGAQAFITGDIKYHDYFTTEGTMLLADIGHFESEQFTIDLLIDLLKQKFSSFALLKTGVDTNPVKYFPG